MGTTKRHFLSTSGLVRADAEEEREEKKEEKADARMDEQLKTFINDMRGCMDALGDSVKNLHSRMDAMEKERSDSRRKDGEEEEERKEKAEEKADARRKDGEEEEREEGKPERVAADKKRKDNSEDVSEEKGRQADARRKDGEEEEKKEEKEEKADAKADAEIASLKATVEDLTRKLENVSKFVQTPREDADATAMADAQARAEEVYSLMGRRAPVPLSTDSADSYNRRIARELREYSPRFKEANIHAIADSAAFSVVLDRIYADALEHANSPARVPEGRLLERVRRSPSGHVITEFQGSSRAWMGPMSGVAQAVTAIHDGN